MEQEEADDGGLRPKTPMEFQGLHRGTHLAKILPRRGRPAVDGSPLAAARRPRAAAQQAEAKVCHEEAFTASVGPRMLEATYRVSATPSSDWLEYVG